MLTKTFCRNRGTLYKTNIGFTGNKKGFYRNDVIPKSVSLKEAINQSLSIFLPRETPVFRSSFKKMDYDWTACIYFLGLENGEITAYLVEEKALIPPHILGSEATFKINENPFKPNYVLKIFKDTEMISFLPAEKVKGPDFTEELKSLMFHNKHSQGVSLGNLF